MTQVLTKDLTGTSGKEAVMVTVEYAPGGTSAAHRHNAHTFVYVLEGSMLMQVKGGKEVTLGPGQTFYESPDDVPKGVIIIGHVRRLPARGRAAVICTMCAEPRKQIQNVNRSRLRVSISSRR